MDRLEAMTLFVAAVDGGSLAAAARRHGRSAAAVTRAIAGLERAAGEPLLLRSTRRLGLTPAGERHLATWRDVLARLADLEPAAPGAPLHGTVRLTAPELFGRRYVMPAIERFAAAHPHLSVRATLSNQIVDLIGDGIDLAVRLSPLADSALVVTRIGQVRSLLCASPAYLHATGMPADPSDLTRHRCIGLDANAEAERWAFARGGRVRTVRIATRFAVDHAAAGIDAALRGHGIVQARSYQVAEHLASRRLVRLLEAWELPPVPAHVVLPAGRLPGPATRALIDYLVPALRNDLSAVEAAMTASSG